MTQVIGKCSLCGGIVTVPMFWGGITPATPTCTKCGAVKDLPTVEMTANEITMGRAFMTKRLSNRALLLSDLKKFAGGEE